MNVARIPTTLALRARSVSASASLSSSLPVAVDATTMQCLRRRRSNTSVIAAAPKLMTMKHSLSPLAKSNSCCCCWHPPISHRRRWHSSSVPRPSASTTEKLNENDKSTCNSIRSPTSQSSLRSSLSNTNAVLDTTTLVIEEPPRRTILTPPVTTTTNTDQLYESRSEMVGFDVHDGTVPTTTSTNHRRSRQQHSSGASDADGDDATTRRQQHQQQHRQQSHRRDKKEHGSLMDPYYVPPQEGMTHLIQGGTPCDIAVAGSRHRQPYRLAEYGEESVYTLILLRHGER